MHDAYISLPGKARVGVDNQTLDGITHSFSRSTPSHGITGRLDVSDVHRWDMLPGNSQGVPLNLSGRLDLI